LQEVRFFTIYLAKINARDVSTRAVRFPIYDFQKIMEMSKLNITQLQHTVDRLLRQIVSVPLESGGFKKFQLFKKCSFDKDEREEWYVEIDAHDEALPLMFDFKDKYFTYKLWNIFRLKSTNHIRMYELLKQYENLGERTIDLNYLKEMLGLKKTDYPRYDNFKMRILNGCQEALDAYTDIKFNYEPIRKRGRGRQVQAIKFIIAKNENYADPLLLDDFIDMSAVQDEEIDESIVAVIYEYKNERLAFLAEACNNEFSEAEMQIINDILVAMFPYGDSPHFANGNKPAYEVDLYNELKLRYDELNLQGERRKITSRFGYLKKMLK
jgi:hypothetical protein